MDEQSLNILFYVTFVVVTIIVILVESHTSIIRSIFRKYKLSDEEKIRDIMIKLGYDYDSNQDIFYSRNDAWQKKYGYCKLYDEAAPSFDMIIDCEPIYFDYENKKWLIEFWKGQYGMCTGAEVGIYKSRSQIKELFNSTLYEAIDENNDISVKFSLSKGEKKLLKREGFFWWITGFILGEYLEPEELSMSIDITLKDNYMLEAFLKGIRNAGYLDEEIKVEGLTVSINYEKPHTKQPYTRNGNIERLKQMKNKRLCNNLKALFDPSLNSFENLVRLKNLKSDDFKKIESFLKGNRMSEIYRKIEENNESNSNSEINYLNE